MKDSGISPRSAMECSWIAARRRGRGGGGSTIDAAKAAEVLCTLGGDIEQYFGTGLVTETVQKSGKVLSPHVATQTAASSGAHLTSFSLVDILSHGRSCAVMNPYYTVFFAPAIEDALRMVGEIYRRAGFPHQERCLILQTVSPSDGARSADTKKPRGEAFFSSKIGYIIAGKQP